ncbi:phosphopantetheine-binding protein [Kitasatospora sp. GP82]|uniref:phosphopantetheine-binding protein n=1 Tax=Kitasatospora sp. GP82 TaxID=3035089 RepID=UPI0024731711|nr:phosphopantetheine-binding protein [Kitasatospora sp. GP82]MDH6128355.1 hypothetical protein [Kitasatospora sp. GP82]
MSSGSSDPAPDTVVVRELVRGAWVVVLGHDDFGNDDEFFTVGGHSLLVARVMAQLGQQVGARLPLRLFFDHPTVTALTGAIEARTGGRPGEREVDAL